MANFIHQIIPEFGKCITHKKIGGINKFLKNFIQQITTVRRTALNRDQFIPWFQIFHFDLLNGFIIFFIQYLNNMFMGITQRMLHQHHFDLTQCSIIMNIVFDLFLFFLNGLDGSLFILTTGFQIQFFFNNKIVHLIYLTIQIHIIRCKGISQQF